MLELPRNVQAYKRTPTFSSETVPKGLLSRHNTKEKTWGLIVVLTGSLLYSIFDHDNTKVTLQPGVNGVIEPQVYHKVLVLTPDTTFYIEFYAVDAESIGVPKIIDSTTVISIGTGATRSNPSPLHQSPLMTGAQRVPQKDPQHQQDESTCPSIMSETGENTTSNNDGTSSFFSHNHQPIQSILVVPLVTCIFVVSLSIAYRYYHRWCRWWRRRYAWR